MAKKSTYGFERQLAKNAMMEQELEVLLLRRSNYLGNEAQAHARSNGGYKDQTGNLKNSIGYHVLVDKQQISEGSVGMNSPVPSPNGEGSIEEANSNFQKTAANYDKYTPTKGIGIVVVAGMRYAAAVEAKGYNVLDLTWTETKKNAKSDFEKVRQLILKKYGTKRSRSRRD